MKDVRMIRTNDDAYECLMKQVMKINGKSPESILLLVSDRSVKYKPKRKRGMFGMALWLNNTSCLKIITSVTSTLKKKEEENDAIRTQNKHVDEAF
jgi:hypothetical protein